MTHSQINPAKAGGFSRKKLKSKKGYVRVTLDCGCQTYQKVGTSASSAGFRFLIHVNKCNEVSGNSSHK